MGFQLWGQFVGWPELMDAGRDIERLGFDSLWSNDHFYPAAGAPRGPVFEGWMTLAGWAAITRRVRMGCLVSGAGYRNPALLVKMATALDHLSGGRVVLGLGAGWHELEHRAFGFPFPAVSGRLQRLDEAAGIVRGLLEGRSVTATGRWCSAEDAVNEPPPLQSRMPLLIGGSGERKTLRTVARYADIWNGEGDAATIRRKIDVLAQHCRDVGRAPGAIAVTVGLPTPLVRDSDVTARDALVEILERHGMPSGEARASATSSPFATTAAGLAERLSEYRAAGVEEVIFDLPAPFDTMTLSKLAEIRAALAR